MRDISWVTIDTIGIKTVYSEYIKKFLRLEGTSIEKLGTGKMIAICSNGLKYWENILERILNEGTKTVVYFIFAIITIWRLIGVRYVLVFIIFFVLTQIIIYTLNKSVFQARKKANEIHNEMSRSLVKIIMSKFEILQSKKEEQEICNFLNQMDEDFYITKKRSLGIELMYSVPEILIFSLKILIVLLIGLAIFEKTGKYSDLVLFTGVMGLIDTAVKYATALLKDVSKDFVIVEKLWETFDEIPTIKNYDEGKKFMYKKGDILIKNVSFNYDNKKVFSNFSLHIPGSKKIAFVGESGGGKTTIIKLLAGYIQPDIGNIYVDDQNINILQLKSYYKDIGYLTQEPSVFDGTVYENLVYALEQEPSLEKIQEIVQLAKCEFVWDFTDGLNTEIGEKGVRLSGGQKQRLAIAKIMLKNPKIIFLDEPTSALDSFNEELVNIALDNLFEGKTVIVVAHRLQTVKQADIIFFLQEGIVTESGTHEELIQMNGKYKKMLELQSGF